MKFASTKHWNSDEKAYNVEIFDVRVNKSLAIYEVIGKVLSGTRTGGSYGGKNNTQPGLHRNLKGVKYWTAEDANGKSIDYQFPTRKAAANRVLEEYNSTKGE